MGGEEKIGIVDLPSMTVIKRLATEAKPNGSAYAPPFRKVDVSNTLGKAVSVVDVRRDEVVKTLMFGNETAMPQYDAKSRKVNVNLRNTNEIADIDPATGTMSAKYPVQGCQLNHGMPVDSGRHRAFILCTGNRTQVVFALDTHKSIAHFSMPAGADVLKFDAGLGRIYVACSSGFISVFDEHDANRYQKVEDFPVEKMVHSLAVNTATHRVYAPEQQENGWPAARVVVYEAVRSSGTRR
jgi:DNA-binding beta-propeller fold protein YncE